MSVNIHSFAPLLLRCKEPPMHNQHCRSLIDTMKSLTPAALTLKPLRRPSNRSSPRQHFIRLCSHIVHVVYCRTWYVCHVENSVSWEFAISYELSPMFGVCQVAPCLNHHFSTCPQMMCHVWLQYLIILILMLI